MTDSISERLRVIAEDAKTDTSSAIWDYPNALSNAADHIDAQDATIKALVEALEVIGNRKVHSDVFPKIARAALTAAKETT